MKWNRARFVKRNSKEYCILCDSLSFCLHSANTLQPILTEDRHWARHRDTNNMTPGTCTDEENWANAFESTGREEVADSQAGEQPPSLATIGKSWKVAALKPPQEHSQDKGTSVMLMSIESQGHIESFVALCLTASCGVWGQLLCSTEQSPCWELHVYSPKSVSVTVSHGLFVTKVRWLQIMQDKFRGQGCVLFSSPWHIWLTELAEHGRPERRQSLRWIKSCLLLLKMVLTFPFPICVHLLKQSKWIIYCFKKSSRTTLLEGSFKVGLFFKTLW